MMKPTQLLFRRNNPFQTKRAFKKGIPRKLLWGTKNKKQRYERYKAFKMGKAPKKILKGDYVQVVSGRNSSLNHQGKVKKINYWTRKIQVEGFSAVQRKAQQEDGTSITQLVERDIPLKHVRLLDPETEKPISVSLVTLYDEDTGEGRRYRLNKSTGSIVPFPTTDPDSDPETKQQINPTTDTDKDVVKMATYYEEEFIQLKNEYLRVMELQEWNEAKLAYEAEQEKQRRKAYIQQEHDVLVVRRAQEILREQQAKEQQDAVAKEHEAEHLALSERLRAQRMQRLETLREKRRQLAEQRIIDEEKMKEDEEKQQEQRRLMAEQKDDTVEDFFDVEHSVNQKKKR